MPISKRLILIIDDDNITRLTLTRVLEKEGDYQVINARNGEEGVEQFKKFQPDMVLMDVMMPVMDGYHACEEIRKISDADATPIIMLTGLNDVESIGKSFDVGATDFITKPINWPILSQRVRYAMRASELYTDLRKKQAQLIHAQRIAKLGYFEFDRKSRTFNCSSQLLDILQIDEKTGLLDFDQFIDIMPKNEQARFIEKLEKTLSSKIPYELDHHINCNNNDECIVQQHGEPVFDMDGNCTGIAGTIQDITERKQAEALIEFQTYYDGVTELPNRHFLTEQIDKLMIEAEKNNRLLSVILFHIDRFREVNDTLGHRVGDQLLRIIARQFNDYFRDDAIIARFDGATFALVSKNTRSVDESAIIAQQVIDMLSQPYMVHEHEVFISGSVGITLHPMSSSDKETLLKNADTAMSRARKNGGNQYQFFSNEMNVIAQQRLQIETDLRKALDREQFQLFYQPQFDCQTQKITGMEALIRWIHPERGLISPLEFIPIAEETGLIISIGEWVMHTAVSQTCKWHKLGYPLRVGVNLSALQFMDDNLISIIKQTLDNTGLNAQYLDLEITESIAMHDFEVTLKTLQRIKEMGVKTSIDDFGTGHSSLSYLQRMPVDTVKIDRSFIKDIGNGDDGALAKAIIAMAHSLQLNVIAEGIETTEHMNFLREQYCDELQGFLIGCPLPRDKFEDFLHNSFAA